MRRYHRYEVVGLQHLLQTRPALVVGYHGRPIAHDLCMLLALLEQQDGRIPHAIMHGAADQIPVARHLVEGMEFVTGDGPDLEAAIARGDHVIVTPGGTREGCRSHRHRYALDWGKRRGYLRLAARYGLPIVPAAAHGVDDAYFGLNDGYAWGKRLNVPGRMPAWLGIGPLGLWPASPPFPVRITTFLGAPIPVEVSLDDEQGLARLDGEVRAAVQALLDRGADAVEGARAA